MKARLKKIENIFTILQDSNLVKVQKIPPKYVCVDDANRNKIGLVVTNAYGVGVMVVGPSGLGFSFHEVESNSICFQLPTDPDLREAQIDNNDKLIKLSNGAMAPNTGQWRYTSVAGSHITVFCNAVDARCIVPEEYRAALGDRDGRCDVEGMYKRSPNFKRAVAEGWNWRVVDPRCAARWPRLKELVQETRNCGGQVACKESEVQVAYKAWQEEQRQIGDKGFADWDVIERFAKRSKPDCSNHVPIILEYTKVFSGGSTGKLLKDILDYGHVCGFSDRIIGQQVFNALVKTMLGGGPAEAACFRKHV